MWQWTTSTSLSIPAISRLRSNRILKLHMPRVLAKVAYRSASRPVDREVPLARFAGRRSRGSRSSGCHPRPGPALGSGTRRGPRPLRRCGADIRWSGSRSASARAPVGRGCQGDGPSRLNRQAARNAKGKARIGLTHCRAEGLASRMGMDRPSTIPALRERRPMIRQAPGRRPFSGALAVLLPALGFRRRGRTAGRSKSLTVSSSRRSPARRWSTGRSWPTSTSKGRLYVADSSGLERQRQEAGSRPPATGSSGSRIPTATAAFDRSVVFADKMMFPEGAMWLGRLALRCGPAVESGS